MSFRPNAEMQRENAADLNKKNINFESAMVNVGSLVTYLCSAAVRRTLSAASGAAVKAKNTLRPLGKKLAKAAAVKTREFGRSLVNFFETVSEMNGRFAGRMAEVGFGRALMLQLSDIGAYIKNSRNFAKTVINYTFPVICLSVLAVAVVTKTSADYGVTVEYNGQEIGVVSEESIINEAQAVVDERATYQDAEGDTYITAVLSLKPLGAQDEVINGEMLADAFIQEQTVAQASEPVTEEVVPEQTEAVDDATGKTRAYVITIDGEFVGAVEDNTAIANYLNAKKEEYSDEGVVEVSFDKDIEYTYENYVMPDQVVSQADIIAKLDSTVTEPVYYDVVKGDNPWDVAIDNGMTMDELNDCYASYKGEEIEDITEYFPIGAVIQLSEEVPYLQVMTTKEVEYTEAIDYEIIKTEDDDLYQGDYEVDVKGVEGEKKIVAMVTYRGNTPVSTELISETVVSEPVAEERRVGTRETKTPVSDGYGGSGEYFWPVDGGYISSYQGDGRGHKGIDIAAPYGTPIYATESGTITQAATGWNGGYGTVIKIKHDDGTVSLYSHMSSIDEVGYGDYVVKGQLIAYVGSTGNSTGNHLHFEIRDSNGSIENPLDYVSQD